MAVSYSGYAQQYTQQSYAQQYAQQYQQQQLLAYASPYYGGYYYGGGTGGGSTPAPAPAPAPAAPAPAAPAVTAATVSDLQILIASIPIAQDGQVISAEYHNGLRAALIAMANRLGLGTISEEITVTNAPQLLAMTGGAAWQHDVGVARKQTSGTGNLRGWMEFDLPDGARIKRMQVHASTDSGNGTMRVRLRRQSISGTAGDDLISITVADDDLATLKQGDVTLPDSTMGAAAIEETRFVDNRTHKYLFIAEIDGGVAERNATIATIQVVLGK
jgi:hypothetical protein